VTKAPARLFEDFVPVSSTRALITTGELLETLDRVEEVGYTVGADGRVHLNRERVHVLAHGKGARLGGRFNGVLVYSDVDLGVIGAAVESRTAHQPFVRQEDGAVYYTDSWPLTRIYRDGAVYLDHFDGYIQVANPCWAGGRLFFEARRDPHPERANLWEVWEWDGYTRRRCWPGANPAFWDGRLFWGEWNGANFDYHSRHID